jgi:ATP-dependent Lon protease
VKAVLLPAENEKDLRDVPQEVCDDLRFVFVRHADEVLAEALHPAPHRRRSEPEAAPMRQLGRAA